MGRLRVMAGEDACRILEQHGFVRVRQRGSHVVMQKTSEEGTITVPIPTHAELKRGTLRSVIRQSGVAKSEFET